LGVTNLGEKGGDVVGYTVEDAAKDTGVSQSEAQAAWNQAEADSK